MRGDFVAGGVIIVIGAVLAALALGFIESDGEGYDLTAEFGDWIDYDTSQILGVNGPVEVENNKLHAVGTGTATVVNADNSQYRIHVIPAHADLILMNGQSNAAYYKTLGQTFDAADLAVTPAPELGTCYYFGYPDGMPYQAPEDVSSCRIYDFVNPDGSVRVADKGPEFCKIYHEETGKKVIWVSLGIPGKSIAAWSPTGTAWAQDIVIMDAVNGLLKDSGFAIDHTYVLWAQGETDYARNTGYANYINRFTVFHDTAPTAWGRSVDAWFLLEGRTARVGWVNDAFRQLAQEIDNVYIGSVAAVPDSYSESNTLMLPDNLHYTQRGDNAIAAAAARSVSRASGIAPVYLTEATMTVEDGTEAVPDIATCYRTDGSRIKALCVWDSVPDVTQPGTQVIPGTISGLAASSFLEFAAGPMLIAEVLS